VSDDAAMKNRDNGRYTPNTQFASNGIKKRSHGMKHPMAPSLGCMEVSKTASLRKAAYRSLQELTGLFSYFIAGTLDHTGDLRMGSYAAVRCSVAAEDMLFVVLIVDVWGR
jgi:hypothetical protein